MKDYDETLGGLTKSKRFSWVPLRDFLNKYRLTFPLYPETWKKKSRLAIEGAAIFDVPSSVSIVPPVNAGHKILPIRDEEKRKWSKGFVPDGTPDEDILFGKSDFSGFLMEEKFLTLRIDLTAPKHAILQEFEEKIDFFRKYVSRPKERNTSAKGIDIFEIWDEFERTKKFSKVASKLKLNVSTVRKGYLRAFDLIMLEKYNPRKYNRKGIAKEQLAKTCQICDSRASCRTLCPSVLPYIEQDYASRRGVFFEDRGFELLPSDVPARSKKAPRYE